MMTSRFVKEYKEKINGFLDLMPQPAHEILKKNITKYRAGQLLYSTLKSLEENT